ncbi:MAG: flagellar filament capping protein FliD [Deferribacteraceae bacterium]|jgi:flagellar hook-associated protein 2|nr:flagellar filament capping protein FliD [Deferribacteraceae bacterium]
MGVIRAGGLASGLDTNTIIDELVKTAKEPVTRLENSLHLKELEKTVYNNVNEQLNDLRTALFNLRLESVFKAKSILSSSPHVASATVTNDAKVGSHVVEVLQTAQKAYMSSRYTSTRLNIAGGGVTTLDQTYRIPHVLDQLEGTHTTNITANASSSVSINVGGVVTTLSTAVTLFEPHEGTSYKKYSAAGVVDPLVVDHNGEIVSTPAAGEKIQLTVDINGTAVTLDELTVTVTVSTSSPPAPMITVSDGSGITLTADGYNDINTLMSLMEQAVNIQLNEKLGTDTVQYLTFRADFEYASGSPGTWDWRVAAYNISTEDISLVSASGSGASLFGVDTGFTSETTATIAKYHVADSDAKLQTLLSGYSSGVIYGVMTGFSAIQSGLFQIVQDASMNVRTPTKTSLLGDVAGTDIYTNSNQPLSGGASGLSYSNLSAVAGTFTINGVEITIDSADRNVNEIMAIVNSSGAGVVMQLDSATNRFLLTSNETGYSTISTGATGDTSKFFEIFKVSVGYGATEYPGNTAGNIDADTVLSEAPFTNSIASGIFSINGVPIYVNAETDTINDIVRKVNNSGAGVTLSYDATRDKFLITSKDANPIVFGSYIDTSNILEVMGLTYNTLKPVVQGTAGTDAIVKIDGQTYRRNDNEIKDVIEGVTLKISSAGTTVIDISSDTSKAVEAIAAFVKIYNNMIDTLKLEAISEDDRDNKMTALTEDDKADMSEDDIEKYMKEYDELHSRDIILKSRAIKDLMKNLRINALGIFIDTQSKFKSLRETGINVVGEGDYTLTQYGFLITESTELSDIISAIGNNTELMANLRDYADDLYLFFAQTKEESYVDSNGATQTRTIYKGWTRNYEELVRNYQDVQGAIGVKIRADSAIETDMQRIKKDIEVKQRRAEDYLELLWRQFSAMETKVAAINSQSTYIEQLAASALNKSSNN